MIEVVMTDAFYSEVDTVKLMEGLFSRSEAKRLISQGAVFIDGEKVGRTAQVKSGDVLRVGKRVYRKIQLPQRELTFERNKGEVTILGISDASI